MNKLALFLAPPLLPEANRSTFSWLDKGDDEDRIRKPKERNKVRCWS